MTSSHSRLHRACAGPREAKPALALARALAITCSVLLASCATPPDLTELGKLRESPNPEDGLRKLESAAATPPRQPQAYASYVMQRTALVGTYMRDAEALRAARQFDAAEIQYRNAQRLEPGSAVVQAGLDALGRDRRREAMANDASEAIRTGDFISAERIARAVLQQDASDRTARGVMKLVAEQKARTAVAEPRLKTAMSRLITLELRDAPLKNVLETLSREGGINLVLDRDVKTDARTTIVVRDTNLEDVLKILLMTNQLERKVLNDNTIVIYPATTAKQREYQELVMRSFYLANADAKQTAAMIRAMVKTKDIFVDEKLNLLIMRDTPEAVRLAEQLVGTQDLAEPEVMLDVEVLEVASSLVQDFGINYPTQLSFGILGPNGDPNSLPPTVPLRSGSLRGFVANPLLILNLHKDDGTSNLLANPRIRVKNREKAKVHIGERVPVITTTSTANVGVSSSVSYLETGLKLDVEPNVYLDDEVSIKVQLEVSNILERLNVGGTISYRLGTRNAATVLRLKDGETQVLAGLINNEDRRSAAKVPYASDMPLLGRLFRADNDNITKTEIVLLITPRVLRNLGRPETVAAQFSSGTEASPGAAPMRLSASTSPSFSVTPRMVPALAAPAAPAAAATASGQSIPLVVAAPAQAPVGSEFGVSFTLVSGSQPASAVVEMSYDTTVLSMIQAPVPGAPPSNVAAGANAATSSLESGVASVEVDSPGLAGVAPPTAQVRFKVIANSPTKTQIGMQVSSRQGNISAPSAQSIEIVER